jgi:hypothetical protein
MSAAPDITDLRSMMESWTVDELRAFFFCVRANELQQAPNDRSTLITASVEELFWAYNSKLKAGTKRTSAQMTNRVYGFLHKHLKNQVGVPSEVGELHEYAKSLSYEFLLREASIKLQISDSHCEPVSTLETHFLGDHYCAHTCNHARATTSRGSYSTSSA